MTAQRQRQLGRVLAVAPPGVSPGEVELVVVVHGGPGEAPRVATWSGRGDAAFAPGDLVERSASVEVASLGEVTSSGGSSDSKTTAGLAPSLTLVTRGAGEWPPSQGAAGADLGRFVGPRWERLAARSRLLRATREWFHREGFLEVETPLVVPSPGTEAHLDPVGVRLSEGPGREAAQRWLITSPEYAMKRLLAAGAGPIYQLGKVFRDGERGGRHRPEFTMLEWYRPGAASYEVVMDDCERLVRELVGGDSLSYLGRRYALDGPWPRHRFFDLLRERADLAHPEALGPDAWLMALVDRVEATLGVDGPEFLIEWPIELASLSRQKPDDPRLAERFELYLAGLELANAFSELTDAAEQRARCERDNAERRALGKPELPLDEDFLGALACGLPPSAGIALGFDRLVMLLTDAASIDDVLAF